MKIILLCFVILFVSSTPFVFSEAVSAPELEVIDGQGKVLHLSSIGQQIIVGFYETKDTKDVNDSLKSKLEQFEQKFDPEGQKIFVLAVADCSKAPWPIVGFLKSALVRQSKKMGHTLFGDWTGKMQKDYEFQKDASNFFIIDKDRRVVYRIFGKATDAEINDIEGLLVRLLKD